MKHKPLSRVENLIRRVVEEPFSWFGVGALDPFQLATHLLRYYEREPGLQDTPYHFKLSVHPDDINALATPIHTFEEQVADYVVLLAARRGYHLKEAPKISIEMSEKEKSHSAHISVLQETTQVQDGTAIFSDFKADSTQAAIEATDAFLILQGRDHIPLDRPVIRIGRRMDNDIILDMPSISRQHVMIRWRQRFFVLYDVSSHGRTIVNGLRVREHVLRPGDVIALSDVLLVYGEGRDSVQDMSAFDEPDDMDSTMLKPEE